MRLLFMLLAALSTLAIAAPEPRKHHGVGFCEWDYTAKTLRHNNAGNKAKKFCSAYLHIPVKTKTVYKVYGKSFLLTT
jgi:hypothetical protein